jgi:hypothetical protein
MKGILGIGVALAALFVAYVIYSGGSVDKGGASGGNFDTLRNGGQQAVDKGQSAWTDLSHQPWFYTAVAALILGILGFTTWKRIGAWGRGITLVLTGIGIAIFLSKVGGR